MLQQKGELPESKQPPHGQVQITIIDFSLVVGILIRNERHVGQPHTQSPFPCWLDDRRLDDYKVATYPGFRLEICIILTSSPGPPHCEKEESLGKRLCIGITQNLWIYITIATCYSYLDHVGMLGAYQLVTNNQAHSQIIASFPGHSSKSGNGLGVRPIFCQIFSHTQLLSAVSS